MSNSYDAAVIGAGPGGYVAAIRLGQLGKRTVIIDREALGGTCLNWGCIPSKAVIHAAKKYESAQHGDDIGITAENVSLDLGTLRTWKDGVVTKLTGGVGELLKRNGVTILMGTATIQSPTTLSVETNEGSQTITAENIIIATGATPIELPGFSYEDEQVWDSRQALDLEKIPEDFVVIGGGVIGLELGMAYQKLGSRLTVIELLDQILPGTDRDIVRVIERKLKKTEAQVFTKSKATGRGDGTVTIETPEGEKEVPCDRVLVAVGVRPNTATLGLDTAGVKTTDRGFIPVNDKLQTNVPTIFAIGDVTGPPLLAHRASRQGIVAAEVIAGEPAAFDVQAMPAATFTDPEISSVGYTENQAKEEGLTYKVGKFPYAASGRALASNDTDGFVKILSDDEGTLLGVHIVGHGASELIGEGALGIEMGATVEDIALTIHPHPTLTEMLMEAAESALGKAIHIVNR